MGVQISVVMMLLCSSLRMLLVFALPIGEGT